jgi:hypothetical protein
MIACGSSSRYDKLSVHRTIPAYSHSPPALRGGIESASTISCFDSVMDDVDKRMYKVSTTKNAMCKTSPSPRESMTLNAVLLHRNPSIEQGIPRSVVICTDDCAAALENDASASSATAIVGSPLYDIDLLCNTTIQVLEEFFDGIDEGVNVRQEVRDYESRTVYGDLAYKC